MIHRCTNYIFCKNIIYSVKISGIMYTLPARYIRIGIANMADMT